MASGGARTSDRHHRSVLELLYDDSIIYPVSVDPYSIQVRHPRVCKDEAHWLVVKLLIPGPMSFVLTYSVRSYLDTVGVHANWIDCSTKGKTGGAKVHLDPRDIGFNREQNYNKLNISGYVQKSVPNNILKVPRNPPCASVAIQDFCNISIAIVKGTNYRHYNLKITFLI